MARVLVLGGGFGGLAAAHEARRRLPGGHEIVLIAASDRFFVGYAKLWDLAGMRPLRAGTGSLAALHDHGIRFVHAEITAIDPRHHVVDTTAGRFEGDYLMVALGSAPSFPDHARPGGGNAFNMYDAQALPTMRAALDALAEGRVVVSVLGMPYICPPAPYEAAFLIEERLRNRGVRDRVEVVVTTPMPATLPMAGPGISARVATALADRGIQLRTGQAVSTLGANAATLTLGESETLDYTLLFGVPQATPPAVVAGSPLAGQDGWIWPDKYTCRTQFGGVYAAGDCTAVENLPRAGVFAEAMGRVAGANIAAEITGGQPERYDGTGYCFLEFPERRASALEGQFFADPHPVLRMAEPSAGTFARKQAFEAERLRQWLTLPGD